MLINNYLEKQQKVILCSFITLIALVTLLVLPKYPGSSFVYIAFTIASNTLLYMGFNKNAIFFDAFIGVFFWLGFWLKTTLRLILSNGLFNEAVGNFDASPEAFDRGLLVAVCGLMALVFASIIRRKYLFNYSENAQILASAGLFKIYEKYRSFLLSLFVVIFIFIAASNALLGIYQKGSITQTFLPFGINGVYKWLLLFGLASISALVLRFEFELNKSTKLLVMALALFETFLTNVSQLSRGMVLNAGGLLYGVIISLKVNNIKTNLKFLITTLTLFVFLFVSSVLVVNFMRTHLYNDDLKEPVLKELNTMTSPLFIDRWVGIEGVLAVSSYPKLDWDLFATALREKYNENETSFYDNNFITSSYIYTDKTKHHFISLPGIIAFFFYPGSYWFLFISMFVLGGFAAFIEYSAFKLGGKNLILCSLLGQVVAYRFASFGYVPAQSYLLFGAIYLNLFLIYFAEKMALYFNTRGKLAE